MERGALLVIRGAEERPGDRYGEAADVLFHLTVLLAAKGIALERVMAELARREGTSGLEEKASRSR